ncbi:hypothetical protein G7046_g10057 [Stylonectria norvegica]|nr:hypothetical protein G7046_g10057 [Stylonectria norvegica]
MFARNALVLALAGLAAAQTTTETGTFAATSTETYTGTVTAVIVPSHSSNQTATTLIPVVPGNATHVVTATTWSPAPLP